MGDVPWTADQVEWMFHSALKAGDAQGVDAAIRVMLRIDARRAIDLYDDLAAALRIARADR